MMQLTAVCSASVGLPFCTHANMGTERCKASVVFLMSAGGSSVLARGQKPSR